MNLVDVLVIYVCPERTGHFEVKCYLLEREKLDVLNWLVNI